MKKTYFTIVLCIYVLVSKSQNSNPDYFPIGVWLQSTFNAQAYKDIGANMYVGLYNPLNNAQLKDLQNAGMKVICMQNNFGLNHLNDTIIYGWAQDDEPDNAQYNDSTGGYDPCIDPAKIISKYNKLKANDPSRPVYLNLGQGVSNIQWIGRGTCTGRTDMYPTYNNGYLAGCDIGSFDIYPVNSDDAMISGKLWYVPKGVDSLYVWCENTKPMWTFIETTLIDANSPRKPTTDEVKSEVWMALIHEAKGIAYFCHSFYPFFDEYALLNDPVMKKAVTKINAQIISLAPVLNSATTTGYAAVSSSNPKVPIDIMTKKYKAAKYIFAVAMRPGKSTATFTITSGSSVTVIGENRTIAVSGGKFTDNFSRYQVHLYKISSGTTDANQSYHINIFPNPVVSSATIEIPENAIGAGTLIISDLQGKIIYEAHELTEEKIILNRNGILPGTYLCIIKDKTNKVIGKSTIVFQ